MRLSRIFEHLTHNTLANLAVGDAAIGEVSPDKYPKLITLVNAGLLDLYTRFPIRTRDLTLQLSDGQNIYPLLAIYAESDPAIETKYILDSTSVYKFTDNILSIDEVYNEIGESVPLNDAHNPDSVFTPSAAELQVPYVSRENMLSVIYRATPDIIGIDVVDPSNEEVDLPYHFMEAITSFIAWKMYTPIDGSENPKGIQYLSAYLAAIKIIKDTGTAIEDSFSNTRFGDNGWV